MMDVNEKRWWWNNYVLWGPPGAKVEDFLGFDKEGREIFRWDDHVKFLNATAHAHCALVSAIYVSNLALLDIAREDPHKKNRGSSTLIYSKGAKTRKYVIKSTSSIYSNV